MATVHYGLGFLIGSGEAIYNQGSKGILYAFASAAGLFSLTLIAPFYLKEKYPIWYLIGKYYGTTIRRFVASLSGFWMIGIIASQILGGSWALSLFKINNYASAVFISILIFGLSTINMSRLSKIFFYMLMFSSLTLLIILFYIGIYWIPISLKSLFFSIPLITFDDLIGVFLTTILVTFIGMDFHQFLVRAKDKKNAVHGALLGGGVLIVLSILLLSVINGSINTGLVGDVSDAKQTIPSILLSFGNAITPFLGVLFSLPLVFVSIGSRSGVTRIVARTISDLDVSNKIKMNKHLLTVVVAFLISLSGKSIINLVVSFYAIYVASVFIPFLLFLLDRSKNLHSPTLAIRNSILAGFAGSLFVFLSRFIPNSRLANEQSTYIIIVGFSTSIISYLLSIKFNKNESRKNIGQ